MAVEIEASKPKDAKGRITSRAQLRRVNEIAKDALKEWGNAA